MMKISRILLIVGLVSMDAVSAQKDDKQADAAVGDDFFFDAPIDGTTTSTGAPTDIFACAGAPEDADCTECLDSGCVMTGGSCLSECAIADASCWDVTSPGFVNNTVDEICDIRAAQIEDDAICGGVDLTDCETCTSTVKSDGVSTCDWYSDGGELSYCGSGGCGMMGICPVETCDMSPEMPTEAGNDPCNGFPTFEPCLVNRMGCVWIADSCQRVCDAIADAACYSTATFPNMTEPEICEIAAQPVEGPTDGGMPGDMVDTEADMEPCNGFPTCEPCLNNRMGCVWIADSCQRDCDAIADAACYSAKLFSNMTGPEICEIAAQPVEGPTDGGMPDETGTTTETPASDTGTTTETDTSNTAATDGDRTVTADEAVSAGFSGRVHGALVAAFSALAMVMA